MAGMKIERQIREITNAEREFLLGANANEFRKLTEREIADCVAAEFLLGFDRIQFWRDDIFGLPERMQLYSLELGGIGSFCFELCFMDHSMVSGTFPSPRLRISFVVRQAESRRNSDSTMPRWAFKFDWGDEEIEICQRLYSELPVDGIKSDDLKPINRYHFVNELYDTQK